MAYLPYQKIDKYHFTPLRQWLTKLNLRVQVKIYFFIEVSMSNHSSKHSIYIKLIYRKVVSGHLSKGFYVTDIPMKSMTLF